MEPEDEARYREKLTEIRKQTDEDRPSLLVGWVVIILVLAGIGLIWKFVLSA